MDTKIPVNVVVAEYRQDGELTTSNARSYEDRQEAIQMILAGLEHTGVDLHDVTRIYSEWKPSDLLAAEIALRCPNAAVTWSFQEGDEGKFEKTMRRLYRKRWWQFWKKGHNQRMQRSESR
jgi:hypothetical protein